MEEGGATTETFLPPAGSLDSLGSGQANSQVETILLTVLSLSVSELHNTCFAEISQLSQYSCNVAHPGGFRPISDL